MLRCPHGSVFFGVLQIVTEFPAMHEFAVEIVVVGGGYRRMLSLEHSGQPLRCSADIPEYSEKLSRLSDRWPPKMYPTDGSVPTGCH